MAELKPLFSWRSAISESDLSATTRHVALALSLYMNERGGSAHPGPTLLAQDTGYHVSTVKEKLAELEGKGWLTCVERGGRKGERRHANEYEATVPAPALFDGPVALDDPSPSGTRRPECGDPSPSPRVPVAVGDPISPENSPVTSPSPPSGSRSVPYETDFEDWWSGWPKKVDKADARANYAARRRQGIEHSVLCASRDNYVRSKRGDTTHMKYPSTFLFGPEGPWSEFIEGIPAGLNGRKDNLGAARAVVRGGAR